MSKVSQVQHYSHKILPVSDIVTAMEGVGRYFLIWPLYSCSILDCITDLQRRWLRGRLREVAVSSSINQAAVLEATSRRKMINTTFELGTMS